MRDGFCGLRRAGIDGVIGEPPTGVGGVHCFFANDSDTAINKLETISTINADPATLVNPSTPWENAKTTPNIIPQTPNKNAGNIHALTVLDLLGTRPLMIVPGTATLKGVDSRMNVFGRSFGVASLARPPQLRGLFILWLLRFCRLRGCPKHL